jgi:hypothetical protein
MVHFWSLVILYFDVVIIMVITFWSWYIFGHWSFCILILLLVLWLLHFGHGCYWYYDVIGFMTFYY